MSQAPEGTSRIIPLALASERTHRHEVEFRHRVGPIHLDLKFTLTKPWTVLFAPSGAGKTTVLRLIAGLERPDFGRVVMRSTWPPLDEHESVLADTAKNIFVAPHKRHVGLVPQRPALFPHMSVRRNVLYRMQGLGRHQEERRQIEKVVDDITGLCRIGPLADKMPSQLSGGERQRVALARAIAAGFGNLLMLDEPFTGMDGLLRDELIAGLKELQAKQGAPILMVTHDLGEVFAIDAEVMRMDNGKIVAAGPPEIVLADERDRLLAQLGQKTGPR